jgi:hypothetical protein
VNVGDDTTTSNSRLDESIELLITADGELQVTRGNTLHLQVLRSVTGKLQNFSSQILENGSAVDGSSGTDTSTSMAAILEEAMDTADRKLECEKVSLAGIAVNLCFYLTMQHKLDWAKN